ncbi:RHS repeat-associated core domain-containing protein [Sorangium sp. So ce296]|uniref:RHS repeat-associated core domain-containing protein n=1 Tax=Sorangium sp. So ce296 TaxID=3133296 RepID=UPI003F5D945C
MTSPFLEAPESAWVASNALAFALRDRFPVSPGHTLVVPRRLVPTWFDATADERAAIFELVDTVKRQLDAELHPDGYNIGINAGEAAGQTVMHLHVHVIPRFRGDVDDPRGGVRHVIPGRGNYLAGRPPPLATGGAEDPFLRHLAPVFARATDVAIFSAFVQESGLDVLESHVFAALARGARIRLVTGDYLHITQAAALAELLDWAGGNAALSGAGGARGSFEARVVEVDALPGTIRSFHPKSWRSLHRWTADSAGRETDDIDVPRWVYQVANHLGSARLDLDAQGGVIAYEEYFPFGGTAFVAGDDLRAASWRDYRFSGKERDDLTGFYYFGFRYYAPWLCRWLTPDPIGAGGGLNLYQYVLNNPVNLIDPEGLDPQRPGQRLRTRYVTYEQFAAAVPEGYRAQIDPGRRWTGLFSPDQQGGVTVHQSESTFRAAARRAAGGRAEIWIYDPRYQEGLDRGLDERSARERAEIFHSIDEALRPFQAPPTPDGAGGAGGAGAAWPGQRRRADRHGDRGGRLRPARGRRARRGRRRRSGHGRGQRAWGFQRPGRRHGHRRRRRACG